MPSAWLAGNIACAVAAQTCSAAAAGNPYTAMALHVAAWAGRTAAIPALGDGAVYAVAAAASASRTRSPSVTPGADPSQVVSIQAGHSVGIVAGKTKDWRAFALDLTAVIEG